MAKHHAEHRMAGDASESFESWPISRVVGLNVEVINSKNPYTRLLHENKVNRYPKLQKDFAQKSP